MSAHKFDKALQEKVHQLRLEPSPGVWAGVAEELNRKRRRRGAAWIFTAAAVVTGIAILAIGSVHEKNTTQKEVLAKSKARQIETQFIPPAVSGQSSITSNNDQLKPKNIDQNSTFPDKSNSKNSLSAASGRKISELISTGILINEEQTARAIGINHVHSGKNPGYPKNASQKINVAPAAIPAETITPEYADRETVKLPRALNPAVIQGPIELTASPLVITPAISKAGNQISDGRITPTKLSKPDKWHTSVVFGAGASALVESGLQQYNALANDYLSSVAIPAGIATIQQRPSDVKAGPSFRLGAQVSRSISKKWSAGIGLQYAFFSNRITVGNTPDSTITLYNNRQDLVSSSATFKAAGNSGTNFYNQFHFIQVPLQFNLALGARQRWDYHAGISIGYLVGVNALQYNNQAGVYYRDNDNYRKWQTAMQMGFQYAFQSTAKLPFQLGPFVQYQLSSLDKSSSNKHILVFGLEARLQID